MRVHPGFFSSERVHGRTTGWEGVDGGGGQGMGGVGRGLEGNKGLFTYDVSQK